MATITDVARAANVSTATVSHVINGTRPVKEATRTRVEDAIRLVGYHRDALARALRRNVTETIGLVVSDPSQPVFADMIRGAEDEARAAGYTILLAHSGDDVRQELDAVRTLKERRVDGLILGEVSDTFDRARDLLSLDGIPLVLLDRLAHRQIDQVGAETVSTMRAVVAHLIASGHDDLMIVAGDLSVPTLRERFEGYESALSASGAKGVSSRVIEGVRTDREAWAAVTAAMRASDRPRALVTSSTNMTVGALRAMRDLGLKTPDDVALVSFDELPYADIFSPQITSVVQPAGEIGRQAVRLLFRRLHEPDAQPQTIRLNPRIAHRLSCGCNGLPFSIP